MAFNPFHSFRKHQKVIFAVLTIICMFVFILTGFAGKADPLSNLLGMFGGKHQGDKVATLYGRDLYQSDITRLAQRRALVNQIYIAGPVAEGVRSIMDDMVKDQDAADQAKADKKDDAKDSEESWSLRIAMQHWKTYNDPKNPNPPPRETRSFTFQQDLNQILQERETTKSEETRHKFDAVASALRFETWALNQKPGQAPYFFGGSSKTEDLLDFEVWKRQADNLGVVLTKEDVRKEVAWDAAGRDVLPKGPWKDDASFKPYVVQDNRVTPGPSEDDILSAITDEYRVSIAQTLLMGHASGVRGVRPAGDATSPDPLAPFDFYSFYRTNRTTLKAAFLALPVSNYLAQVTNEPGEDELRQLFDKYRDAVPEPTRAAPAFKQPRRVKIEYITAKPDSPFYKDAAVRADAERLAALQMVGAGTASSGVGAAASWANLAYGPHNLNAEFLEGYARYVQRNSSAGDLWVDPLTGHAPELHDPVNRHPEAAAALVGRVLGGALAPSNALAVPVGAVAGSALYEANDRTRRGAVASLLGAAAGDPFVAASLAAPHLPASPPPAAVAGEVFKELRDQRAPEIALDKMTKFIDELAKLKSRPEEAKQYVAKAVKDFGFEYHTMDAAKDAYELATDPALKDLKDAYSQPSLFNPGAPKLDFIKALTATSGVYDPKRLSGAGVAQGDGTQNDQNALFSWMFMSKDRYVFWRSEDDRAQELSYNQARPEVVKAWKFQEARRLALIAANRIKAEAEAQASPLEAIKAMRDQKAGDVFEIADIARLMPVNSANPGVEHNYVRYAFPEGKIPMAPDDLLDRLMGLKKPGEAMIFQDKPVKVFYVSLLDERVVPGVKDKDFLDAYADAVQPGRGQLWHDYFVAERDREYHKKLMRQLREEAGAVDEKTGLLVINKKDDKHTPQNEEEPAPTDEGQGPGGDLGGGF